MRITYTFAIPQKTLDELQETLSPEDRFCNNIENDELLFLTFNKKVISFFAKDKKIKDKK